MMDDAANRVRNVWESMCTCSFDEVEAGADSLTEDNEFGWRKSENVIESTPRLRHGNNAMARVYPRAPIYL